MKKGFTLVEMIFYVAIVALVLLVIVNMVVVIGDSNREFRVARNVQNASITAYERITRDIQGAEGVNSAGSTLSLDMGDSNTIEFTLLGGEIHVLENGFDLGPITSGEVVVSDLYFNLSTNSSGAEIVQVQMVLESNIGGVQKIEDFQSSALVKGSL